MRIDIQTRRFDLTPVLRQYVERRLAAALGRSRAHVTEARVLLSEHAGLGLTEGARCTIQLALTTGETLTADAAGVALGPAVDAATWRVRKALRRSAAWLPTRAFQPLARAT